MYLHFQLLWLSCSEQYNDLLHSFNAFKTNATKVAIPYLPCLSFYSTLPAVDFLLFLVHIRRPISYLHTFALNWQPSVYNKYLSIKLMYLFIVKYSLFRRPDEWSLIFHYGVYHLKGTVSQDLWWVKIGMIQKLFSMAVGAHH